MSKNKYMRLLAAGAVLATMAAMPQTASAVSFTGQIDYTGVHTSNNADLTLATQSTIDLNFVVINTGSFALITLGTTLNHASPLVWDPSGAPYTPLWSDAASGIAFDLNSLHVDFEDIDQVNLSGSGVFYCTAAPCNYDDTPGTWNMTLNNAGAIIGSFSSSSTANAVSEPGTLALLGLSMLGFGLSRRRKSA